MSDLSVIRLSNVRKPKTKMASAPRARVPALERMEEVRRQRAETLSKRTEIQSKGLTKLKAHELRDVSTLQPTSEKSRQIADHTPVLVFSRSLPALCMEPATLEDEPSSLDVPAVGPSGVIQTSDRAPSALQTPLRWVRIKPASQALLLPTVLGLAVWAWIAASPFDRLIDNGVPIIWEAPVATSEMVSLIAPSLTPTETSQIPFPDHDANITPSIQLRSLTPLPIAVESPLQGFSSPFSTVSWVPALLSPPSPGPGDFSRLVKRSPSDLASKFGTPSVPWRPEVYASADIFRFSLSSPSAPQSWIASPITKPMALSVLSQAPQLTLAAQDPRPDLKIKGALIPAHALIETVHPPDSLASVEVALDIRIFAPGTGGEDQLAATRQNLERAGFDVTQTGLVTFDVTISQVRFYSPSERAVAETIASRIGGIVRDFTGEPGAPIRGLVEVWLAGLGAAAGREAAPAARPNAPRLRSATVEQPVVPFAFLSNLFAHKGSRRLSSDDAGSQSIGNTTQRSARDSSGSSSRPTQTLSSGSNRSGSSSKPSSKSGNDNSRESSFDGSKSKSSSPAAKTNSKQKSDREPSRSASKSKTGSKAGKGTTSDGKKK